MQNKFTIKKITSNQSVGNLLSQARFDLELSIEKVSQQIDISEEYLIALESGDYFKLPGEVYLRNWLKKYAKFLNLSVDKIIKLYEEEKSLQQTMFDQVKKTNNKFKIKFNWTPDILRNLALVLVICLVLGYILVSVVEANQSPKLEIKNLIQDEIHTSEEIIKIQGQTEKDLLVFINQQTVVADSHGYFEYDFKLNSGINLINIQVVSKNNKQAQIFKKIIKLE